MCRCNKCGSRTSQRNLSRIDSDISSDIRMSDVLKVLNEQRMENDSDSDSESKSSTGSVNVSVVVNSVGSENVLANDSSATNKPDISEGDITVESESESDSESKSESKAVALIEDKSVIDVGDIGSSSDGSGDDDGDDGNGEEKVTICHKGQTIEVAQSAVQAHLDHGDTLGSCEDDDSSEDVVVVEVDDKEEDDT